jgi:prepilin-type N-terminal cleavage/methylation domain-containing protein
MTYKPKGFNSGFTMVELLISMGILGFIFVAASQLLSDSMRGSQVVSAQTSLQEELRSAAAIIDDEVQRSYYVFPPQGSLIKTNVAATDITVNWSQFDLGTSNLKTGLHESTIFFVSNIPSSTNPPFLAMITAPRDPNVPCLKAKIATPTSTDIYDSGQGCYQFVAYYGVLRPKVTRGLVSNSTTSSELLDNDSANTGRMVLMEFRLNLIASIPGTPLTDWGEVGCEFRGKPADPLATPPTPAIAGTKCNTTPTTADPITAAQALVTSIPALSCIKYCENTPPASNPLLADAQRFATRMKATVDWINTKTSTVTPSILVDYIDESLANGNAGFQVLMPPETFDARGVFQVRLRLKGKVTVGGKVTSFPAAPVTVYASPRNIAPLL